MGYTPGVPNQSYNTQERVIKMFGDRIDGVGPRRSTEPSQQCVTI